MSVSRDPRWPARVIALVALGVALACKTQDSSVTTVQGEPTPVRADCPDHTPFVVRLHGDSVGPLNQLTVSGATTLVPEFHDCQRFIVDEGKAYGPLVGIFAYRGLDTLTRIRPRNTPLFPLPAPTPHAPPTAMPAVAEIVNFDTTAYAPLGIQPGINCLYLFPDPDAEHGLSARMVPVGLREESCGLAYDPAMTGTPLLVLPKRYHPAFTAADYPPVARWDWDPISFHQYIGIKCADAWCEIGPNAGFSPSPNHPFPLATTKERRPYWIKGWNDEQWLALGTTDLTPSNALGSLIPNRDLGDYTISSFDTHWVPVAKVALAPHLTQYQSKFHFTAATMPAKDNQIFMCKGSWDACRNGETNAPAAAPRCPTGVPLEWWARIDNTVGESHYRCVIEHNVGTIKLPGTARWRWMNTDETIWVACATGCCQVSADE